MRQALLPLFCIFLVSAWARAERTSLSFSLAEQRLAEHGVDASRDEERGGGGGVNEGADGGGDGLTLDLPAQRFGEAGSWYWSVSGMGTISDDSTDARLAYTVHAFIADGFEFNLSLAGWGFFQDGQDAAGINPGLGFRWHFINDQEKGYSVYAQTGIGLLWATDEVPDGGTRFNFTPHAGVGATFGIGDGGTRLDLGLGWHHISNASTSGSDDNPARDSLAVWVGVMFPLN